ncbi:MAG: hypothetical protein AB1485_08985, partial [Candidatus Thermoplasmatota archaeon]
KYTMKLEQGWNFVSIPLTNKTITTAQSLASAIGENCSAISYWNNSLGRFITHVKGSGISNFDIESGMGYFVHVTDSTLFTLTGFPFVSKDMYLKVGWNSIGWFNDMPISAEVLIKDIGINCMNMARWNYSLQKFVLYPVGTGISDFKVRCGCGYLVYVTKETEWVNG